MATPFSSLLLLLHLLLLLLLLLLLIFIQNLDWPLHCFAPQLERYNPADLKIEMMSFIIIEYRVEYCSNQFFFAADFGKTR